MSLPRVLFVSRERVRLPLEGAQARKWNAVSEVLDYRVLASSGRGAGSDPRFSLMAPVRPRMLDGVWHYLALPVRIAAELRSLRPDIVYAQGVHETAAALLARRLSRIDSCVILDVQGDWHEATRLYGSPLRRLLNPLNDAFAPLAVRHAEAVHTVSSQTTAIVRKLGVEPLAVFPSYVDAEAFLASPPSALPERPRALFVGVLERYKAFDTLAEAWRIVAQAVPTAKLHIVSDGSLRELAAKLVADLPDQTTWAKSLTTEEVAQAMDDSWVFCLPSRSEGLPRVALEAACRGRAIVGGNRAGIPDVVRDGENGYLVDPDDPPGLARTLIRILSDRSLAERLGMSARRTGEEWVVPPAVYAQRLRKLVDACASRSSSC